LTDAKEALNSVAFMEDAEEIAAFLDKVLPA
jgi:hypothetical protein